MVWAISIPATSTPNSTPGKWSTLASSTTSAVVVVAGQTYSVEGGVLSAETSSPKPTLADAAPFGGAAGKVGRNWGLGGVLVVVVGMVGVL